MTGDVEGFASAHDAVFYAIQHGSEMVAAAGLPDPDSFDITVHADECLLDEIDLCTCTPRILHHGHEPSECEP